MTTILNLEPSAVPLTRLDNGAYRVAGTRIPLERVIESHKAGATPQEIVGSFDTLKLADVYSLISFYLDNKDAVDEYVLQMEALGDEMERMIKVEMPLRPGLKAELLRRNALLETGNAEAGR